jgi:transcriptional regulator with XRE-family HTH domain
MDHDTFREFLKSQMSHRKMTMHEFAALVGVSHSTIHRFVYDEPSKQYIPTLEFLHKLAQGTGVNLNTIIAICFPDTGQALEIDAEQAALLEAFKGLAPEMRPIVMKIIRSLSA